MTKLNWGFDLTTFKSSAKFQSLLKRHGLSKFRKQSHKVSIAGMTESYNKFKWKKPDGSLEIVTGNNPVSGEYSGGDRERPREKGYASYIGITGDAGEVKKLVKDIKDNADVNDESPNRRDFI